MRATRSPTDLTPDDAGPLRGKHAAKDAYRITDFLSEEAKERTEKSECEWENKGERRRRDGEEMGGRQE